MISYELGLLKKPETLADFESFKQGKTTVLGFKDIFARLSMETWMKVYEPYIEKEIHS
jgi:hypothetical protein